MGTYYKWVCRARMEQLDPGSIGESAKWPWGPKTIGALAYAVTYGPWRGCAIELVDDHDDFYYDIDDAISQTGVWNDIAEECLAAAETNRVTKSSG